MKKREKKKDFFLFLNLFLLRFFLYNWQQQEQNFGGNCHRIVKILLCTYHGHFFYEWFGLL